MKKLLYIVLAAAAGLFAVSCNGDMTPDTTPALTVINANYSSLVRGQEQGTELVTVPVSATSSDGTLNLNFYSTIPFLSPGTYTVGEGLGAFNGHFKSSDTDGDIKNGMLTVALDGMKDYSISGTVRLTDEVGTIVKIRAKGALEYDIPTNYYYTEENGTTNGIKAVIYKLYDKATSVQCAQIAVVGNGEGDFSISEGTAVPGTPNGGCWFFDASYGTYIMLHGGVSISSNFPGRLNFSFSDKFNYTENPTVDFNFCEKKQDLVPAKAASSGDFSFMMLHFYSVESPVVKGMYELTIKMNYTPGDEFLSMTGICATPNPVLEPLQKDGDTTGGLPFMPTSYEDYLIGAADPNSNSAIATACFYVVDGERYEIPFNQGFAMVLNAQMSHGAVAALFAPTNLSYDLPEPLFSYMAAQGMSIWNLFGYYF